MIVNSNAFERGGFLTQGFHSGLADYLPLTEDNTLPWHNPFKHQVIDTISDSSDVNGADGQFHITPPWDPNQINLSCDSYQDVGTPESSVAFRGALMVHEGMHAWEEISGNHSPHDKTGTDPWFYHFTSAYFGGDLWNQKTGAGTSHSVIQVEVEYLCDLVDNPGDLMPLSVRLAAQSKGIDLTPNLGPTIPALLTSLICS